MVNPKHLECYVCTSCGWQYLTYEEANKCCEDALAKETAVGGKNEFE